MAHYLTPHSPEWFAALEAFNPFQAVHTTAMIQMAKSVEICSVCGDDPASDYKLVHPTPPDDAVATIRLCVDCRMIREQDGESFLPYP
jgi:hypothetical protein